MPTSFVLIIIKKDKIIIKTEIYKNIVKSKVNVLFLGFVQVRYSCIYCSSDLFIRCTD